MSDLTILPVKPLDDKKRIQVSDTFFDVNGGACVLDCAPPRSGKTVRISNYFLNPNFLEGKLDAVHIYSSTLANGDASGRFLVDRYSDTIYGEYSDSHLKSIIDFQDSIPKNERPAIAIVFDDFIGFDKIKKNSYLFRLSSEYRHHNIKLLMYSCQLFRYVPSMVRQNINYAVIGQTANKKEINKMSEELGARYGDEKQFNKLLKEGTRGRYDFLYLDLYGKPAKAYRNFNELIYEAPDNINLSNYTDIDIPEGDYEDYDNEEFDTY
jgi:hypothetical protein